MIYHITGSISAAIFLLTIAGLWSQLNSIWTQKRLSTSGHPSCDILSLNQFVSSFLAFFAFFLYAVCLPRFNHYLAWPRLAACFLTLRVLYEIMRDRRDRLSTVAFGTCAVVLVGGPFLLLINPGFAISIRVFSQGLIVLITIVMAQGCLHQVGVIRQRGTTGVVSLRMHQLFFLKDISTIAFALAMEMAAGWPLLLLSSVSAATKLITIWHFRWVRSSPLAEQRRHAANSLAEGPASLVAPI